MRVRCKTNRGIDLPETYWRPRTGMPTDQIFHLTVGDVYTVYALGLDGGMPSVYVADDVFVDGPRRYPLCLFELTDARVSAHWELAVGHQGSEDQTILAPRAWLKEEWFFERMFDGEATAVALFTDIKRLLDAEAAPPIAGAAGDEDLE